MGRAAGFTLERLKRQRALGQLCRRFAT